MEDFEAALTASEVSPVIVFKHSATCPISHSARRRLTSFAQEAAAPPIFELVVQEARPVSNQVAASYDVRHESPQVLIFSDRAVIFHASHGTIRERVLREALQDLST